MNEFPVIVVQLPAPVAHGEPKERTRRLAAGRGRFKAAPPPEDPLRNRIGIQARNLLWVKATSDRQRERKTMSNLSVLAKRRSLPLERSEYAEASSSHSIAAYPFLTLEEEPLPELTLSHLRAMTDDAGVIQHAVGTIPSYAGGYTLDDNARALVLVTKLESARAETAETAETLRSLASRYLAFVLHAFEPKSAWFRNFMSYSRCWEERSGSEDSHARALWALGAVAARSGDEGWRILASELFEGALPVVSSFTSPRAWAYSLLGIAEYVQFRGHEDHVGALGRVLAERLVALLCDATQRTGRWHEDRVRYADARLSQALMLAGWWMNDEEILASGLRSLAWMTALQGADDDLFTPRGSGRVFPGGDHPPGVSPMSLDACGTVAACLLCHRITGEDRWRTHAQQSFGWFLGHSRQSESVYDSAIGGCHDGLRPGATNENRSAEATISFLLALLDILESARGEASRD